MCLSHPVRSDDFIFLYMIIFGLHALRSIWYDVMLLFFCTQYSLNEAEHSLRYIREVLKFWGKLRHCIERTSKAADFNRTVWHRHLKQIKLRNWYLAQDNALLRLGNISRLCVTCKCIKAILRIIVCHLACHHFAAFDLQLIDIIW